MSKRESPSDGAAGSRSSGVWYQAGLSSEQIAAGHLNIIQRLFADAISDAADARGAFLFATGVGSDATTVFFSPASIGLMPHVIAQCGATPGPAPDRAIAALLVGGEEAWDLLPHSMH